MGIARPIGFLALGDSYTVGECVPPEDAWPRQLADRLTRSGRPVEPVIVATTAWTSGELLAALEEDPVGGAFDLVSIQIGVNDQFRGLSIDEFTANAEALIGRAREARSGRPGGIFVLSIPDWGVTPFAEGHDRRQIALDIDRFNRAWHELAARSGIPWIDVTASSRRHPEELADDGLHPSGAQYQRWVDRIVPVIETLLGAGG